MTPDGAFTAFRVGDRIRSRIEPPWEVFGERARRFEVHLNGARIELERGPISIEGYSIRVFRPREETTGVGFAAGTDLSERGIDARAEVAEATTRYSSFPARRVELPSTHVAGSPAHVETVDRRLWDDPARSLHDAVEAILAKFHGKPGVGPSFGSIRATLAESTLTNSEGIQRHHQRTDVDFEMAISSRGGPEGPPPGEYWVTDRRRRLDVPWLTSRVDRWCRAAQDTRFAKPTPAGATNVVTPPRLLADILPPILGYRLGGAAELRKMTPPAGTVVGPESVTIVDDGLLDFGLGSAPFDDEGTPQAKRPLVERGVVTTPAYDVLHASSFGRPPTGNGRRDNPEYSPWFRFGVAPAPQVTNLVLQPGSGGSPEELAESMGEGILIDQLGYAFPDALSGAFGGELRIGYRVHGGKIGEPVRGGTIGGVVFAPPGSPSLLASVQAVGGTPESVGYVSVPPLWVDGLTVAPAD